MTNTKEFFAETCPETLKPCPFCGGEAKYDDFEAAHYCLDMPGVACETCYCRNFADSKEEAIQKWNSRHATPPLAAGPNNPRVLNFPLVGWVSLKVVRAIERAHGIGEA